jgi:mannosyl-3-phosphoglycerate phosphatase
VRQEIYRAGLWHTQGGRYHHLLGPSDKEVAARQVTRLFERSLGSVRTVGLGDSLNDLPLLAAVDRALLVKRPDGTYDQRVIDGLPSVRRVPGIGPRGWREAVMEILAEIE